MAAFSCLRFEVGLTESSKGGIMIGGLLADVLGTVNGLLGSVFELLGGFF